MELTINGIWLGSEECRRTQGFLNCVSHNVLNPSALLRAGSAQRLNALNDLNVSILAFSAAVERFERFERPL